MHRFEACSRGRSWVALAVASTILAVLLWPGLPTGGRPGQAEAGAQEAGKPGKIVLTYGVAGVLTEDGTLWQYRPDQDTWLTIDAAFRGEGRDTNVLPLPVPVDRIAQMASFGFIVTTSGESYFYDLNSDTWKKLPAPGTR
jgi:hypothetical protein